MVRPNPDKTKAGNLKSPTSKLLCEWIKLAWDEIPADMIIKAFLRAGISNALDGTEDDFTFDDEADTDVDDNDDGVLVLRCAGVVWL